MWKNRILEACSWPGGFKGEIFVMWGTDCKDHAVTNAKLLQSALPQSFSDSHRVLYPVIIGALEKKRKYHDTFDGDSSKHQQMHLLPHASSPTPNCSETHRLLSECFDLSARAMRGIS